MITSGTFLALSEELLPYLNYEFSGGKHIYTDTRFNTCGQGETREAALLDLMYTILDDCEKTGDDFSQEPTQYIMGNPFN